MNIIVAIFIMAFPRIAYIYSIWVRENEYSIHISVRIMPVYRKKTVSIKGTTVLTAISICMLFVCALIVGEAESRLSLRNMNAQAVADYKSIVSVQADQLDSASALLVQQQSRYANLEKDYDTLAAKVTSIAKKVGVTATELIHPQKETATRAMTTSRSLSSTAKTVSNQAASLEKVAESQDVAVQVLTMAVDRYEQKAAAIPTLWPIYGLITSPFGIRNDPFGKGGKEMHNGIDIAAPYGTPIRATAAGKVEQNGWNGSYGISVTLAHGNNMETLYGHMSRSAVTVGQKVKKGQVIGYEGSTGRATGAHVHYEVIVGGKPVDPMPYLE